MPVLVDAATFGGPRDQGVAFVLDLTERKKVEQNLRESERRYRESQMDLAHGIRRDRRVRTGSIDAFATFAAISAKVELIINLKTAKTLGLTVPRTLL